MTAGRRGANPYQGARGVFDPPAWPRWTEGSWSGSTGAPWNPTVAIGLGLGGMHYALRPLLMAFLHDDARAAKPWAIIAAIAKINASFLLLCLTIAFEIGLILGSFAAAFLLRAGYFLLHIPASLACWSLAAWLSVAATHSLRTFYAARQGSLGWRDQRARWGVDWKV